VYQEFYGFSEDPFTLNPDPKFLYLSLSHWKALSSMISGIKEKKGIMVITGEVGVGKTILIYKILKDLGESSKTAFIFNSSLNFENILRNILHDLSVPMGEEEKDLPSLRLLFKKYLYEKLGQEETVSIVIDEAQNLNHPVLEDLFNLSTLGPPGAKLVQILLVGHPVLEVKLNSNKLHLFKEKIGLRRQIKPLMQEEGRKYINHRLVLAGRNISEIFTMEAANRIWEFAGGIPRVINFLCNRALLIGYKNSCPKIDLKIVKEAIKDIDHGRAGKSRTFPAESSSKNFSYKIIKILFFLFAVGFLMLPISKILAILFQK